MPVEFTVKHTLKQAHCTSCEGAVYEEYISSEHIDRVQCDSKHTAAMKLHNCASALLL
jgi:hypothetical protein